MKKLLLEILQNSPENTLCQSLLFNKVAGVFHRTPLVAASVFFQSILLNKIFILARKLGTSLSFYERGRVPVFKTTGSLQVQST